jgi:hypothetical protein
MSNGLVLVFLKSMHQFLSADGLSLAFHGQYAYPL